MFKVRISRSSRVLLLYAMQCGDYHCYYHGDDAYLSFNKHPAADAALSCNGTCSVEGEDFLARASRIADVGHTAKNLT